MARALRRAGELTSLWRELNPRNRHHLAIVGASALVSAVAGGSRLIAGDGVPAALGVAVNAGAMFFLAWAMARELDPDFPRSAFVAAGVAAAILAAGSAPAGAAVAVLVALRIVTRSTGRAPVPLDLAALPVLAAAVAWTPRGWVGGAALAGALLLDARMPAPAGPRSYAGAVAVAASTLGVALWKGTLALGPQAPSPLALAAAVAGLVAFPAMRSYLPRSPQDRGSETISGARLKAGRYLGLATAVAALAVFGGAGVPLLTGVWAAFIGVAAYHRLIARGAASR